MVCPRCAGENTLFIHEGPRKGTKNSFARSLFGLSTKSGGEHLFYPRRTTKKNFARSLFGLSTMCGGEHPFYPRRATKGHEELLCKVIIWSVHEGRGRTPFLSTKGHEENLCEVIIWSVHDVRGRTPFLSTKGHEENLCKIVILSVREGPRRTLFWVDANYGRRSRESLEKQSDSARRRPSLPHCEQFSPNVNGTW